MPHNHCLSHFFWYWEGTSSPSCSPTLDPQPNHFPPLGISPSFDLLFCPGGPTVLQAHGSVPPFHLHRYPLQLSSSGWHSSSAVGCSAMGRKVPTKEKQNRLVAPRLRLHPMLSQKCWHHPGHGIPTRAKKEKVRTDKARQEALRYTRLQGEHQKKENATQTA